MMWKDANGNELHAGDIVEDTSRRIIGRVIWQHGLPALYAQKKFSYKTMGYELLDMQGPQEAYIKSIVPRHTKLYYFLRGYVLDDVMILRAAEPAKREYKPLGVTRFDAPVPWA